MARRKQTNDGYMELGLATICPNPWNPRKRFAGKAFDELVDSIRQKGVLEPILVRPIPDGSRLVGDERWPNYACMVDYEVVAGERRFRAAHQVSSENGGPEHGTIPAIVRALSDDEAFDVMTIENIQRENLTELEEARNFQMYLDRKGKDAAGELAERTGISVSYIRRRVRVLALPKKVLAAWEDGTLKYGHMEQLARLKPGRELTAMAKVAMQGKPWQDRPLTVRELKQEIDNQAPKMARAVFDLEAAGCLTCPHNSDVQGKLFAIDQKKDATCDRPACFKKKINDWLAANWKKSKIKKKCKTNGFRFFDAVDCDQYEFLSGNSFPKCRMCENKVTLIQGDGQVVRDRVCMDPKCHAELTRAKLGKKSSVKTDAGTGSRTDGPRVAWHGEHFRDEFFKEKIAERWAAFDLSDPVTMDNILRLLLFGIMTHTNDLDRWFGERHPGADPDGGLAECSWFCLNREDVLKVVLEIDPDTIMDDLSSAALHMILSSHVWPALRRTLGEYLGIDLAGEWRFHKDYLKKKTIGEMMAFGHDLGIFEDPAALAFLSGKLKRKTFASCKKAELVKVFLESGTDLAGKVPAEILAE